MTGKVVGSWLESRAPGPSRQRSDGSRSWRIGTHCRNEKEDGRVLMIALMGMEGEGGGGSRRAKWDESNPDGIKSRVEGRSRGEIRLSRGRGV